MLQRGPAFIVAPQGSPGLLGSYGRALEKSMEVVYWDLRAAVDRNVKYQKFGKTLNTYFPFEPWIVGGNRDLINEVRRRAPRMVLIAGAAPIRAGAIAQIKVACPDTAVVLLWPDTLLNLTQHIVQSLPLFDLVGSYSSTAIPVLKKLGAERVEFLPFAADLEFFPANVTLSAAQERELVSDVCFVGNHRPEREEAILKLIDAGLKVKVWGANDWIRRSGNRARVSSYFQDNVLFGEDLARAVQASKISLNVIDRTNYPAANMRFFESFCCRRVSLSSACPEMSSEFPDRESCIYFEDDSLVERARELVNDPPLRERVANAAFDHVSRAHTYHHRAKQLLSMLDSPS